eukprot:TRINITY_DN15677_c0_g1_i1.p1 TRINITY_DN15677_c0_g1~~TRINITY_DN15677_c0_g1_i1.p1  ORF type:complete len:169 (+),score=5.93 TRINITY_DN15677_c0_g1_i1:42-548(+)
MRHLSRLLLTNRANFVGYSITKELGTVTGSSCVCGGGYSDIKSSIANVVGGPIEQAKHRMNDSIRRATARALAEAESRGANAVLNFREQISTTWVRRLPFFPKLLLPSSAFYFTHVSGTAVVLEKVDPLAPDPRDRARKPRGARRRHLLSSRQRGSAININPCSIDPV